MKTPAFQFAVTDDWFRSDVCGLQSHPANRRTLEGFLFPIARTFGATLVYDAGINTPLFKTQALQALNLPPDVFGWAAAQDVQPTDALLSLVAEECRNLDLIVGWELPKTIQRSFMLNNLKFVSCGLSPLRFGQDYYWSVQTNIAALGVFISRITLPHSHLLASATEISSFHRRRSNKDFEKRKFAVIFGQTSVDASLCNRGSLLKLEDFTTQIYHWMRDFDVVYYREHPYGDGANLDTVRSLGCIETTCPPYQLLSEPNLSAVIAISSGITFEAPFFGICSRRLIPHPQYESLLDGVVGSIAVSHEGLVQLFMRIFDRTGWGVSMLGGERGRMEVHLRNVFGNLWGDRLARSDECEQRTR